MDFQCLHLQPIRAFHFGQRGVGVEAATDFAPSDTIFSALCSVLRMVDSAKALEDLIQRFNDGAPPFLISCGFPYVMLDGRPLRFYPAPLSWQRLDRDDDRRKSRWISETIFYGLIEAGTPVDVEYLEEVEALVTRDERQKLGKAYAGLARLSHGRLLLWTVDNTPRVAVDRLTSASAVYRTGCLSFAPGGGIWVGIVPLDSWTEQNLPVLFDILGEHGLGGERSSGYGVFSHDASLDVRLTFPPLSAGHRFITLSYYSPKLQTGEGAVFSEDCAFTLETRRGWMSSPENSRLRRKTLRMIRFGSVLRAVGGQRAYGQLINVAPDMFKAHPVWRYGMALPVPLGD